MRYDEGIFVGYRHYDMHGVEPRFCFGHGLSYTRFEYSALVVDSLDADVRLSINVTNVGSRPGREVVQLYVLDPAQPDQLVADKQLRDSPSSRSSRAKRGR